LNKNKTSEHVAADLLTWHRQALQFEKTGSAGERPDHRLLLSGWPTGVVPELKRSPGSSAFIRLTLKKPKAGFTIRDIDPETAFVLKVHLIVGGRLSLEAHGAPANYYYTRLMLPGRRPDGKRRRCYWSRLIVGTDIGHLTKENPDFHDCRRSAAGQLREQLEDGAVAKFGRKEATEWTLEAVREAIERGEGLPADLTESDVARLLKDGYRLLDAVPLGE
jgi:hypothetical protein